MTYGKPQLRVYGKGKEEIDNVGSMQICYFISMSVVSNFILEELPESKEKYQKLYV